MDPDPDPGRDPHLGKVDPDPPFPVMVDPDPHLEKVNPVPKWIRLRIQVPIYFSYIFHNKKSCWTNYNAYFVTAKL